MHIYVYVACNVGDANVVVQIHAHVKIKTDNAVELEGNTAYGVVHNIGKCMPKLLSVPMSLNFDVKKISACYLDLQPKIKQRTNW